MTFISAFRCEDGIVLGADSQETYGDYKLVVDKLEPKRVGKYEIAVGGAGIGDLVDSLCEYVQEWAENWDALSERALIHLLRERMREFYAVEVAAYPVEGSKRIEAILCLKHIEHPDVFLFDLKGTTVRKSGSFSLIGWDTPILQHFARRLHRKNLPISRGVLLTLYLFSIVGATVTVVGGETRIVIASARNIQVHPNLYVSKIEENIGLFTKLIDNLVLSLPDTSQSTAEFEKTLTDFVDTAKHLRQEYIFEMGHLSMQNALTNPDHRGDAYPQIPPGSSVVVRRVVRNGIVIDDRLPEKKEET